MDYIQKKITCFSTFVGISANSNKNCSHYNFHAFDNFSGNFQNYSIFGKCTTLTTRNEHVLTVDLHSPSHGMDVYTLKTVR